MSVGSQGSGNDQTESRAKLPRRMEGIQRKLRKRKRRRTRSKGMNKEWKRSVFRRRRRWFGKSWIPNDRPRRRWIRIV